MQNKQKWITVWASEWTIIIKENAKYVELRWRKIRISFQCKYLKREAGAYPRSRNQTISNFEID